MEDSLGTQSICANPAALRRMMLARNRKFADLYGAFPVKWLFLVCCRFFVRSGRRFFVPSPAIRYPERAEGVKRDRNASGAWRLAALASLVFRSALTPEHAAG